MKGGRRPRASRLSSRAMLKVYKLDVSETHSSFSVGSMSGNSRNTVL
jgi:hypothetical protein